MTEAAHTTPEGVMLTPLQLGAIAKTMSFLGGMFREVYGFNAENPDGLQLNPTQLYHLFMFAVIAGSETAAALGLPVDNNDLYATMRGVQSLSEAPSRMVSFLNRAEPAT